MKKWRPGAVLRNQVAKRLLEIQDFHLVRKEFSLTTEQMQRLLRANAAKKHGLRRAGMTHETEHYRERLKDLAIKATGNGLQRDRWVRRGKLGVQVLQGIGEFQKDQSPMDLLEFLKTLTEAFPGRYVKVIEAQATETVPGEDSRRESV